MIQTPYGIKSALDIAMDRAELLETIPEITHPMGRSWEQPDRRDILIDEEHALMSRNTFEQLAEYSGTYPTGVYPGKMWRRHDGIFDRAFLRSGGKPEWLLCWFGYSANGPDFCSNNSRKIILVDGGL